MAIRATALVLLIAATALAQAPPGFKTYENKLSKLTFWYPTAYKEVPLPPTEQVLVAKFVLKKTPRELRKLDERVVKAANMQVSIFLFDTVTAPVTAGGEGGEERGPSTVREAMESRSRVTSWKQFEKRLGWPVSADAKNKDAFKMGPRRFTREHSMFGRLVRKRVGGKVFGVYGHTIEPHKAKLNKIIDTVAKSLKLRDLGVSTAAATSRIDRIYRKSKYGSIEWRKQIRSRLAKGWKAVDTDNYLIVHHTKNKGLIKNIARDIEAMRTFYMGMFPPSGEVDKVSVLRLCATKDEYHQYGGPPNTGGYWHPGNEELVLFDYSYTQKTMTTKQKQAMGGRKLSSKDSMLVLRHEAFHQYIFYAIGEFSPHDWFNEGYGDYFSGAVVHPNTGRVRHINPSPWRIHRAKDMCEFGKGFLPLEKILKAERAVFYNRSRVGDYYAGAWSFVYFLKESKEAAAHPQWSKMLSTYFNGVKDHYQRGLEKAGREKNGEEPDLRDKQVAGFTARKKALAETLEGIDVPKLEEAWRQWVVDMVDPWPSLRKKRKK
ncbi:MAG: hypothetical protein ACI85K_003704 [Hyphomicrobiaceae bacterium]|jgi:hypothetical protein